MTYRITILFFFLFFSDSDENVLELESGESYTILCEYAKDHQTACFKK